MRNFLAVLLFAPLLALLGCGNGVVVISDTISPGGSIALDAGVSQTFTATVSGDPSNSGVTWQLNGLGTFSNQTSTSVTYTAPAVVTAAGYATVVAVPVKNTLYAAATQINYAAGPAIVTTTLPTATIGTAYSTQLAETGGYGTLTWTLASGTLPAGLSLSSTGLISGTPTALAASSFTVQLRDSATTPAIVTQALSLTVNAGTLTQGAVTLPNVVRGTAYSSALSVTGGVGPYTWSITAGALPTGISISSSTGALTGTPTATGSFSFTVQVIDSETVHQTATATYSFIVYVPLTISTTTLASGSIHNAYSATLQSAGGTLPLTWSLAAGSSLPAGLSLSSAGVISGTPSSVSNNTFTVQLKDASVPQQTATATLSLNIVLSTLAITTTSLPQATATVSYTTSLQSSGGNAPVTWSLASGSSLPTGLTLSSAGVISGTTSTATTANFTVQATDATPATVSQALTLNVVALATLTVSTTTLPAGNIGTVYSSTIAATGGASPYTWSVSSGALPPGLALSSAGVLSGTPVAAGSYTFTAQVHDSQATPANASRSFTLAIGTTLPTGSNNAELSGSYAFLVNGFAAGSTSGKTYGFAAIGSLTANGTGGLTGVEDINTSTGVQLAQPVTGAYTLGADNRGLMVLTVGSSTSVYAIAASSLQSGVAQSIAITGFDNSTGSGVTATGYAKHQTASAFTASSVNGKYVFGLAGESPCNTCVTPTPRFGPVTAVGVFTADGTATLSAGQEDAGAYGQSYTGITLAGSFAAPSATTGRGTLQLTPTGTLFSAPPANYTYVIVSAGELLLLSNDSHATNALLYGDAQLQQQTTYTAASLTGRAIGYESQANGGDGSATYPSALNAILTQLTVTGSGTATLLQDANRAGTFTAGVAGAITYTTAANGRTAITTGGASNQVVYLYNTNAGFGLDQATVTGYSALIQYEQQVATAAPLPPLFKGSYINATLLTPIAATISSGLDLAALASGGADSGIAGQLNTTLDSSTGGGSLTLGQTASFLYFEDLTGRSVVTPSTTSTTTLAIMESITAKRSVSIPTTNTTTPVVSILQQ